MDGKTCYTNKKEAIAMTTLSIQVDEKVEKEAEKLFSDFGLDISTAVNIFLRQSIRENCIPFNIQKEVPNADTLASITKEQCEMLMRGEIPDIGKDAPPVLQKLCLLMRTRLLRPKVIVEYDRVPYIYPQGNVRITLDENIRSSSRVELFLEDQIPTRPILPVGQHILEVKYDEYLPDFIYRAVQLQGLHRTAFSKYYLCRRYHL